MFPDSSVQSTRFDKSNQSLKTPTLIFITMNTDFLIYEGGPHFITCLNLGSHIKICQDINGTLDMTNEIYNVPTSSPHLRPASAEEMENLDWD